MARRLHFSLHEWVDMSDRVVIKNGSSKMLLLLPSVTAWRVNGNLYFDRKFYDGLSLYSETWPGDIRVGIRIDSGPPPKFGLIEYDEQGACAKFVFLGTDEVIRETHLKDVDVVLASADNHKNFHVASLCQKLSVVCIYGIEYILETRLQILRITAGNPLQLAKSSIWLLYAELRRRNALKWADSIQANGVPAYDAYSGLVRNPLIYFDTRIEKGMDITGAELDERLSYLDRNEPLRLGFSGRLIGIKGADHLVELGRVLHERGVPFSLDIFGDGELLPEMNAKIGDYGLSAQVRLHGAVDFKNELVPYVKKNIDLFVVCHRQSDPSCTYLETYACGVPIAGYDNKAHVGILAAHDVGWQVRMNDVTGLADLIADLHSSREGIKAKSRAAVQFAMDNNFETTFNRRILHCIDIMQEKQR
jgi:colanic acid/amylovoran biosynthesis glycosyltransferase